MEGWCLDCKGESRQGWFMVYISAIDECMNGMDGFCEGHGPKGPISVVK